jgi:hypothetical protein
LREGLKNCGAGFVYSFLMNFPKKSLSENFDYKKELMETLDEKYNSVN